MPRLAGADNKAAGNDGENQFHGNSGGNTIAELGRSHPDNLDCQQAGDTVELDSDLHDFVRLIARAQRAQERHRYRLPAQPLFLKD